MNWTRASFLRRMAFTALACAFIDPPRVSFGREERVVSVGPGPDRDYRTLQEALDDQACDLVAEDACLRIYLDESEYQHGAVIRAPYVTSPRNFLFIGGPTWQSEQ